MSDFDRRGVLRIGGTATVAALAGCSAGWKDASTATDGGEGTQNADAATPGADILGGSDDPQFVTPAEADFLTPGDPVFGVVRNGAATVYPQKVLVRYEIVNDRRDGDPVTVSYCPLTGTVQGFERGSTTFGVSGRRITNNLVMFDRTTET
jgi:hypothetical protein